MAHPTQMQIHHLVPKISKNVAPPEREIAPRAPRDRAVLSPSSQPLLAAPTDE